MRWKLTAPHYLKVPGTEWEYKEVDRRTGRPKVSKFPVPLLLDPSQPGDWTQKNDFGEGDIIVCWEGQGQPNDIVFEGQPTPDMLPLDDEARAESAKYAAKWNHPIESLEANGPSYSETLLDQLQKEVADVQSKTSTTKIEGLEELLTGMAAMMKQNQEMMAMVMQNAMANKPSEPARRV